MCSYSVLYIHTYHLHVAKNVWNSHHLGIFCRERDTVSRFFESLQRAKIKIRCCTVLQVLQLLAGVSVVRLLYTL